MVNDVTTNLAPDALREVPMMEFLRFLLAHGLELVDRGSEVTIQRRERAARDNSLALDEIIDNACRCLPDGIQVELCMENGSAWVELWRIDEYGGDELELPDAADKSLQEQIIDAVATAREWERTVVVR